VVLLGTDLNQIGDLVDVSITGLLLHTDRDFELGAMRPMAISVGNETSQVIAVAKRRIPGVGTAFEFSHISPRDRELLRRLLLRIAGSGEN
ncbi:MAG: PilZ domain-containing protein, partial [Burkholderiales bacterium]